MAVKGEAWVWSQYKGVIGSQAEPPASPLPLFGAATNSPTFGAKRSKWGGAMALAMIIGLFLPKIAGLLLLLSLLMVVSGWEPERAEAFFKTVPGGGLALGLLALIDAILP